MQRSANTLKDTIGVMQNLVVGETQDPEANLAEPGIAEDVAHGFREVRCPVGFDDESCFETHEVGEEGPYGLLTAELGAIDATPSKQLPECDLCWRAASAQLTRTIRVGTKKARHNPYRPHVPLGCLL